MSKYLSTWLPSYGAKTVAGFLQPSKARAKHLQHILLLFVDHFELAGKEPRLQEWLTKYPALASKHFDSEGRHPTHTWFYALDLLRDDELNRLSSLVEKGLGEIELHWHHSNDTPASFEDKLYCGLEKFQEHGFLLPCTESRRASFGFIHGNWSLDNSAGKDFCGVDNEIELLKRAGCYADFTFPALFSKCQPAMVNSIYYAVEDGLPKSYDRGREAIVGRPATDEEFLIFQGPLFINWRDWRHKWHPRLEDGDVNRSRTHGDPNRIDAWVRNGLQVRGRPEWKFLKIFCHGGQDYESVLGNETDAMFTYLEERYNDGEHYKLHYVTAREAYNIVKAAEDGKQGNPGRYRDYVIPKPEDI